MGMGGVKALIHFGEDIGSIDYLQGQAIPWIGIPLFQRILCVPCDLRGRPPHPDPETYR